MVNKLVTGLIGFCVLNAVLASLSGDTFMMGVLIVGAGWMMFHPAGQKAAAKVRDNVLSPAFRRIAAFFNIKLSKKAKKTSPSTTRSPMDIDLSFVTDAEIVSESLYRSYDPSKCDPKLVHLTDEEVNKEAASRKTRTP